MTTYTAYYRSLDSQDERRQGLFDFESAARLGTKANAHDARLAMLELFGNEALAWTITKVERKREAAANVDGQMQLDFRAPRKRPRKTARKYR